ncbi:hypothetical protein [Effusibacillus dendaii]|uniref:Uncharacterized protein n=1 Tax=Effusibacillus dendaii TaxID=2743772 RepID=A0A7I8D7H5_9BACL|nr:hypothetical protein [Effusibacillus dendaii]BCJ86113.1 hypothetical protein skT53_10980 [Effusibacillus dendaii]
MFSADKWIYAFTGLVILILIGMLTGAWRIILYPYLFIIGIGVLLGLWQQLKRKPQLIWVPVSITVLYLILYVWLDVLSLHSPTGGSTLVFGMVPTTALFFLGIWPIAILVSLLYGLTFSSHSDSMQGE